MARSVLWWAVVLGLACSPEVSPSLRLPPRPQVAPGGEEIASALHGLDLAGREERIYQEVARGNVPSWLRRLRRVEIEGELGGRRHRVAFWVTPDYLSVGSDSDFFLVPLSARTGQRIADLVGASLPTPRMVDAIWKAAKVHLIPIRIPPDEHINTVPYYERHNHMVQAERRLYGAPPGTFVAGEKVDVVLTPTIFEQPGKVAVYGWHFPNGRPIQRLVTLNGDSLITFSRGIRLVDHSVLVDGAERDLADVLRDPTLAPLLSRQGVIAEARYPVAAGTR